MGVATEAYAPEGSNFHDERFHVKTGALGVG